MYDGSSLGVSMKSVLLGTTASLFAVAIGCSGSGALAPERSVVLGVTQLDAPTSIAASSQLTATLTVSVGGCLSFDHIEVVRAESSATLTAWGIDSSNGGKSAFCTQDLRSESHSIALNPPFAGPFTIEVNRGRLMPLLATVQVQ
jgi:hypothetical protein